MSGAQQTIFYAAIMIAVGFGIPIFAALNGGLGARLQNPMLAAMVAVLVAITLMTTALLLTEGVPQVKYDASIPAWFYLGGIFVAGYILGMTWIAPRFGVGNAVAFVLLGQLISMALIDHYAWFGAAHHPISAQRVLGLALMAIGVFLSVRR